MQSLIKDVRYAIRSLVKRPGLTAIASITLALGIGANTAIFSIVNAVLLRPAPFQNPDRLVLVRESLPKLGWLNLAASPAEFLDYKEQNQVFSDIAAFTDQSLNLTGTSEPQRIQAERVSPSLFPLLGVQPLAGRTLAPEEDQPGKNNVAILSYGLWQRQFGSDNNVIGKTIKLDDKPYDVVGVMPPGFEFPYGRTTFAQAAQLWIPLTLTDQEKKIRASDLQYGMAALPGTQAAGVTTNLPLVGERGIGFVIEGDAAETVNTAYNAWVSNDYFRALGIQLRSGRSFTDQDREDTPPVVVINEQMQRRFWPNGDAIGKRISWGGWPNSWLTIVGVVSDVKVSSLETETEPAIYMPIFQIPRARENVIYVIRSTADAAA